MSNLKRDARWYKVPDMGWTRALLIGLVGLLSLLAIHFSSVGREIENRLARPFAFQFRHWMGKDPAVDPRLVIYSLGDQDRERFENLEPSLKEWGDLLEGISRSHPRAIVIPKLFASPGSAADAHEFVKRVEKVSTPMIALGFAVGGGNLPSKASG